MPSPNPPGRLEGVVFCEGPPCLCYEEVNQEGALESLRGGDLTKLVTEVRSSGEEAFGAKLFARKMKNAEAAASTPSSAETAVGVVSTGSATPLENRAVRRVLLSLLHRLHRQRSLSCGTRSGRWMTRR